MPQSVESDEKARGRESDPPQRVWRVIPRAKRPRGPAWVVGQLVHQALRHWRFPDSEGQDFEAFLRPFALESGLVDDVELHAAIHEAHNLLARFCVHPLRVEIESAEHYHELPYELPVGRGVIDVLYRRANEWIVADFKTDELRSEAEAHEVAREEGYDRQMARYADAITMLLGQRPRTQLVFLNVRKSVMVVEELDRAAMIESLL